MLDTRQFFSVFIVAENVVGSLSNTIVLKSKDAKNVLCVPSQKSNSVTAISEIQRVHLVHMYNHK